VRRASRGPDWKHWLRRWDEQQESFNPEREHRFGAMLDALEASIGRRFTVLDLGSGPGSLSLRILRRFPAARAAAVDYDPVVRQIGEGALGNVRGRLKWVDAKIGSPGWTAVLPHPRYDAAVSTTALHWLTPRELTQLYSDLARILRRGGVFLNGDYMPWDARDRRLARLGADVLKVRFPRRGRGGDVEWGAWRRWWEDARRAPELGDAFREHDRRVAGHPSRSDVTLAVHRRRLRAAGFGTVAVVWQDFENRVLFARR
jgi:SAM-dependent methyltransferase